MRDKREDKMTIKKWYPNYGIIKRLLIFIKYLCDPYRKKMTLDCYLYYHFDCISKKKKAEILMDDEIQEYEKRLNSDIYRYIFNDKKEFYNKFKRYMNRRIIFLDDCAKDDFITFVRSYPCIVVKPFNMYAGIGFRKIINKDYTDSQLIKEYEMMYGNNFICEECLINDSAYSRIYDKSLNTVRVNTLIKKDGSVEIISIVNQFGSGGSVTDNDEEMGIWAGVNIDTGIVDCAEKNDETAVYYDVHPDTGERIIGFYNERINEIKELAKELALVVPEERLIGWDIAVTDKGLELIEGNVTPELGIVQAMSGYGYRTLFEEAII